MINSLYSLLQTLSLITSQQDSDALVHLLIQKCRSAEEDKSERITMHPGQYDDKQAHKCKVNIL